MKIMVTLEKTKTGWSAHCTDPDTIGGLGASKEEALADWKDAMGHWVQYMKDNRLPIVLGEAEIVSVEVAA